jgi:hypothetical protein
MTRGFHIRAPLFPYAGPYAEKNVVFLDERTLRNEWEIRTGSPSVRFKASKGTAGIKSLQDFYDYSTNTIYCPKWDFEVVGTNYITPCWESFIKLIKRGVKFLN